MMLLSLTAYLMSVAILASVVSTRNQLHQTVAYWGQHPNLQPLESYCSPGSEFDILVLTYISSFGSGRALSGKIGGCDISTNSSSACESLGNAIDYCKSQGKKVLVSIGGLGADFQLDNQQDAHNVGQALWNSWAAPQAADGPAVRPIGNSFVDGWDFDIRSNPNNSAQYLGEVAKMLQANFARDLYYHTYILTASPQCALPDLNMDTAITSAYFKYIFVQFFNNPSCSANLLFNESIGSFQYDEWAEFLQNTRSKDAQLFIGLDVNPDSEYYVAPENVSTLVNIYSNHTQFGGVVLWDADTAASVNINGRTYGQYVRNAIETLPSQNITAPCSA